MIKTLSICISTFLLGFIISTTILGVTKNKNTVWLNEEIHKQSLWQRAEHDRKYPPSGDFRVAYPYYYDTNMLS